MTEPKIKNAELYAKEKHREQTSKNGITPHSKHLEDVVSRLKAIGINDEDILCAGWLHDSIEDTDSTFDEISERFGQRVALLVLSLTKDESLPKKEKELQYIKLLRTAPFEAKLVKLCDISSNLKDMDDSMSKTKKKKTVNQKLHYFRVIKKELAEHMSEYPRMASLVDGINQIARKHHQKPISLQTKY